MSTSTLRANLVDLGGDSLETVQKRLITWKLELVAVEAQRPAQPHDAPPQQKRAPYRRQQLVRQERAHLNLGVIPAHRLGA